MRVLISGVTGFVGMRLGASLARSGFTVTGLARDAKRAEARAPFLERAFEWSALDGDGASEALSGVGAVVHLAGESVAGLWTASKRRRIEESRVETTRALARAIARADARPEVFVSASAVGYYGEPPDGPVTEDTPSGQGFLARVCREWEHETAPATEAGARVVLLRIGLVMGEEGGSLAAMLPAFKAGLGGRIGSGRQLWPWIHADDLVALVHRAIEDRSWSGAYNATAPHPIAQREFAKTLARVLRRPSFLPAPAFAVKSVLGDFASEMLVSRDVVPRRALDAGFVFRFPELEPALRDVLGR